MVVVFGRDSRLLNLCFSSQIFIQHIKILNDMIGRKIQIKALNLILSLIVNTLIVRNKVQFLKHKIIRNDFNRKSDSNISQKYSIFG